MWMQSLYIQAVNKAGPGSLDFLVSLQNYLLLFQEEMTTFYQCRNPRAQVQFPIAQAAAREKTCTLPTHGQ